MQRRPSPASAKKSVPPQDIYSGLVAAIGTLAAAAPSEARDQTLQLLAQAPQGAVCWHAAERAPLLILAPWAVDGGTDALLDRMAGMVTLLPLPLQQQLGRDSVIYAVACGDDGRILAAIPNNLSAWPAFRGAAINGWSLDSTGHSTDDVARLSPVWRCVANAAAHWQQTLLDANAIAAAAPRHLLAERLGRRHPAGLSATAWVAAVTTVLAALQLAWGATNAPGFGQMGAAVAGLPLAEPCDWIAIFSGSWLHPGVTSALVAAAALAFAQPLESAIGAARWLAVWCSAALVGTAVGAASASGLGVGAAAGTAGIVLAQLALARKLSVPLPHWGGLPSRWLWPALLLALAATQWLSWGGMGATAAGAAVGALWGASGAAAWGRGDELVDAGQAIVRHGPLRIWWFRAGVAAVLGTSTAGLALAWAAHAPWSATVPAGWRAVAVCGSGLAVELPAPLALAGCDAKDGMVQAVFGDGRVDTLTVSALIRPAPAGLMALDAAGQGQQLRKRLIESAPPAGRSAAISLLPGSGGLSLLLDQTNDRGPLPRVLSLRCGRLVDVQVSIAHGAAESWQRAAARIAASAGANCPGESGPQSPP